MPISDSDLAQFEKTPPVTPMPVRSGPVIPDDAKVAFLAHILHGSPFARTYTLLEDGAIEFATVLPRELDNLRRLVFIDERTDPAATSRNRNARLKSYLAIASIRRLEIHGRKIEGVCDRNWITARAYLEVLDRLPLGLYSLIESYYTEFSDLFDALIKKAPDRSFW